MGVRKFFPNLVTKYKKVGFVFSKSDVQKNIIKTVVEKNHCHKQLVNNVNELYLDANCLIHPTCFEVFYANKSLLQSNPEKLENLMIVAVVKYIEMLVKLVNPDTLVYIAIDGVAPYAKMKQQKTRRFKTINDHELREQVASRYGVEYKKAWNNSAITPGTEFMNKITNGIINYLETKKERLFNVNKKNSSNIKYIFSTASTPGEGEHKILQYIKQQKNIATRVVYGLDADLLYLTMAAQTKNIFLIRELTEFQHMQSDDGFCFVDIDLMKDCIYQDMIENLKKECIAIDTSFENLEKYKSNFIQDYIFFGFMIGNDFLPSVPSTHLEFNKHHSGLNILITNYKFVFGELNSALNDNYEFLTSIQNNKIVISYEFIKTLFHNLSSEEEHFFKDTYKFKKRVAPGQLPYTSFEEEMESREKMDFYVPDLFQLGRINVNHVEAKEEFYKHYKMINNLNDVISDYFGGLYWNVYYYLDKCQDNFWYYKHKKVPFASDIYAWLVNNEESFNNMANIYPKAPGSYLIRPIEQLFLVLPVQSSYLLPKPMKQIMLKNPDYYPTTITLDMQNISKLWQAVPENIKLMDIIQIGNIFKNVKLTEEEKSRNQFRLPYEIII